ncbi:MAG: Valyl-tRNA synthetase ValS [Parcubacteria group bacterium GW2011_GWB1_46_8]|nr:MAG: Valyl-tRNA synthetase ValS [Parcubacteria group bacterium GW2011_GWF1_45_5]KKU46568.1 MAG: Valyl-tRNA synthetase ValS [Parcubacteria group bacterium GW2011_GWB1_46_8]
MFFRGGGIMVMMPKQFPKNFESSKYETKIYRQWERSGSFRPVSKKDGSPFCIIMPPPNANESLHAGHARFVTIEDVLIRYHRMKGDKTLWLPGADHAGIETQYVFEKKLAKEGKSRFDFDRETLYRMIWDYVAANRGDMENQLRALGASCDWERNTFTLDRKIIALVYRTFLQLHRDGLLYRGKRIVNYCPRCGTNLSQLEVDSVERTDTLYYLDYGPVKIATTRPETIFADVAVAIHPTSKGKQDLLEQQAIIPLTGKRIPIIEDSLVDPLFGTGALKITPGHDAIDFAVGKKHNLEAITVIDGAGRMTNVPDAYKGMKADQARAAVVGDLEKSGLLLKTEPITHVVGVCYKHQSLIEPMLSEQWFIKMKPLAEKAMKAIKNKEVVFPVRRFEKISYHWLKNIEDWNISRQIVWGMRIPAWQCAHCQEWIVTDGKKPVRCVSCKGADLHQDTDTFDTWFSSGQWPFATLLTQSLSKSKPSSNDFKQFYPTSVMETGYDILFFWVLRMIMIGLYSTGKVPFKTVVLHGLVRDIRGVKMSKSKGNAINPLEMIGRYGADALRMSLVWGGLIENDINFDEQKIKGQRNFANKIWNIGRLLAINTDDSKTRAAVRNKTVHDRRIMKQLAVTVQTATRAIESYKLNIAAEILYEFVWHQFADVYLESIKKKTETGEVYIPQPSLGIAHSVFRDILKALHPFMPFVTEAMWQRMSYGKKTMLIAESWPKYKTKS